MRLLLVWLGLFVLKDFCYVNNNNCGRGVELIVVMVSEMS